MSRVEHPARDGDGYCVRCGLPSYTTIDFCPPGHWMTEAELAAWTAASGEERVKMENAIVAAERQSDGSEKK